MAMRLEAVTVCLNYDDFLEQTIRVNQSHFDDWVVVTDKTDKATRDVCTRYGVRTALCPYFERGGEKFAKALAINIGLAHLKLTDWIVHIDADTALPRNTRKHLANIELHTQNIYGIDRVDCPNLAAWHSYLINPDLYEKHYLLRGPDKWPHGSRVGHFDYGGYAPIGFFQLWNQASGISRYPSVQRGDAEHTDMLHALQWPRSQRLLIPEIIAVHLSTSGNAWGVNWHGRKSPRFLATAKPPDDDCHHHHPPRPRPPCPPDPYKP
jgi:Glycosyl transferase family 2